MSNDESEESTSDRVEPPEGYEIMEFDGQYERSETEKAWINEDPDDYEWMTEMDSEILHVLYTGLTLTPSVIADNLDRSRPAIAQRLNALQAGGLVEKTNRGKYKISKKGAGFVEIGHVSKSDK